MKIFESGCTLSSLNRILLLVLLFVTTQGLTQNFEGTITYKIEFLNPMPNLVTVEEWNKMKAENPDLETITETIHYKKGMFLKKARCGDRPEGLTLFITGSEKVYNWKEKSDTAYFSTLKPAVGSVKQSDKTSLITGIQCQHAVLTVKNQKHNVYYNADYFKTNPLDFKGSFIDYLDEITAALGCFPIRIEAKSSFVHLRKTVIDFELKKQEDSIFKIPEFKILLEKK